jgi:hypothetical protein
LTHLLAAGWQFPRNLEALREVCDGLDVARSFERSGSSLVEVGDGPVPRFPPDCVMGELLGLLAQAIGIESLNRLDDARVHRAAAVAEERSIRDLECQGVLEGVLKLRKKIGQDRGFCALLPDLDRQAAPSSL